jgi:hypothetical protein
MKISAPIITLLAGGALAAGLLVANGLTAGGTAQDTGLQVAGSTTEEDGEKAPADDQAAGDEEAAGNGAGEAAGKDEGAAAEEVVEKVRRTYAARVKGGGPLVAISVRDGVGIAYLCDGDKLEEWLKGKAADGRLTLTGEDDAKLTATFNATRAKGSVTVGDETYEFTAPTVKKPSGLYKATAEVRGAKVEGNWIVLPDGTTQEGMVTTNGVATGAPPINLTTGTATVGGEELTVVATDPESGIGFPTAP